MTKFIGRQRNIGLGKEATRGDAVAPKYWYPVMEFTSDDKIVQAINESSYGVITDADDANVVKTFSEHEIIGKVNHETFGLMLLGVSGAVAAPALVSGETIVYDHIFSLAENAQHYTFTLNNSEPNGDFAYPLCSVDALSITAELEKFVMYDLTLRGNKNEAGTGSPSYNEDYFFLPQHCEVMLYADWTDLQANTNPTTYPFKKFTLNISKNVEDDQTLGDTNAIDRLNKQFAIEGTLELLYDNRDFIDGILLADAFKAMKLKMSNGDITLGVGSNPEFEIDLARVKVSEVARDQANNDLVKQTITFKAFYSVLDAITLEMRLRNTEGTAYDA